MPNVHSKSNNLRKNRTLLYFYAHWCSPCKIISPLVKQATELTNVNLEKVDTEQNLELAHYYNVNALPTLILLEDDQEIGRKIGSTTKSQLTSFLTQ